MTSHRSSERSVAHTPPLMGIEITSKQQRLLGKTDPSVREARHQQMLPSPMRNTSIFAATGFRLGALFGLSSSNDFEHLDALERMSEHSAYQSKNYFLSDDWNSMKSLLDHFKINPTTGLPMVGATDTAGHTYGSSSSSFDSFNSIHSSNFDSFSSLDSHSLSSLNDW